MKIKKITGFNIDTSDLLATGETREVIVTGEVGAKFILQVIKASTQSFYNFFTKSFDSSFTPNCNLAVEMTGEVFYSNIIFPASSTTDYQVLLLTPDDETEIIQNQKNVEVINKKISQINNVEITFTVSTTNTNTYSSDPPSSNIVQTSSPGSSNDYVNLNYAVTNNSTDANGFGLFVSVASDNVEELTKNGRADHVLFSQSQVTVDGAITAKAVIKLDSVDGLAVGGVLKSISGGSVNTTDPFIKDISKEAKTITLSEPQTAGDGATLTFRNYGSTQIFDSTNLGLANTEARLDVVDVADKRGITKTARADGGATEATDGVSASVALNGTYFIGVGCKVAGPGISGIPTVTAINTASSTAGTITLSSAVGPLKTGQDIVFSNSFSRLKAVCAFNITNYPTSNTSIFLDLDRFITPGTAS